jgi:hypothetical protein
MVTAWSWDHRFVHIDGSGDVGRVVRRTERAPENAKPEARGGIAYRRVWSAVAGSHRTAP